MFGRTRERVMNGSLGPAVLAKPTILRPREHLTLTRRAGIEKRRVYEEVLVEDAYTRKQIEFEVMGDKRVKETSINRHAKRIQAAEDAALEERRARLKALLQSEEEEYVIEACATVETPLERQAKMRDRARTLKDNRESRRKALAEEKLEEAWKSNCEPLRTLMTRKVHERIDQDRFVQMHQNATIQAEEYAVEGLYAKEWELDRLAKHARETQAVLRRRAQDKHIAECLDAQMALYEQARREEQALKEEEKVLRFAQVAMLAEEEKRSEEKEHAKKETIKRMFAHDLSQKRTEMQATLKQLLDDDLALIAQLEAEKANEVAEEAGKKRRLAQEAHQYGQYLSDMKAAEEAYEKECDMFLAGQAKIESHKRREKHKAEKHKRAEMMLDVVRTLQQQMEFKWNKIMEARAEKLNEAKQMAMGIDALNKQAEAKEVARMAEMKEHQIQLVAQRVEKDTEIQADKDRTASLNRALLDGYAAEEDRINLAIAGIGSLKV